MWNILFCFCDGFLERSNSISRAILFALLVQSLHNLRKTNTMIQAHVIGYFIQCL